MQHLHGSSLQLFGGSGAAADIILLIHGLAVQRKPPKTLIRDRFMPGSA